MRSYNGNNNVSSQNGGINGYNEQASQNGGINGYNEQASQSGNHQSPSNEYKQMPVSLDYRPTASSKDYKVMSATNDNRTKYSIEETDGLCITKDVKGMNKVKPSKLMYAKSNLKPMYAGNERNSMHSSQQTNYVYEPTLLDEMCRKKSEMNDLNVSQTTGDAKPEFDANDPCAVTNKYRAKDVKSLYSTNYTEPSSKFKIVKPSDDSYTGQTLYSTNFADPKYRNNDVKPLYEAYDSRFDPNSRKQEVSKTTNSTNERPCIRTDDYICYQTIDHEALDPYILCRKWNCFHGPHNPKFFNNLTNTGDVVNSLNEKPTSKECTTNLPGIREFRKAPFRPYHWDRGGIRKMDWEPSPYYDYNKDNYRERKPMEPYYKPNNHSLLKYHQGLLDFERTHPRKLLEEFLYRKVILPHEGMDICDEDKMRDSRDVNDKDFCDDNEFKSKDLMGSTMSDLDIWRLRFLSGNYQTFDNWK